MKKLKLKKKTEEVKETVNVEGQETPDVETNPKVDPEETEKVEKSKSKWGKIAVGAALGVAALAIVKGIVSGRSRDDYDLDDEDPDDEDDDNEETDSDESDDQKED